MKIPQVILKRAVLEHCTMLIDTDSEYEHRMYQFGTLFLKNI